MTHDVFISYSSNDKRVADAICSSLETGGIHCWIAPRDISPGEDWPSAITKAVHAAKLFILIFSEKSNSSHHVHREVQMAVDSQVPVLPFRIEEFRLSPTLQYYLSSVQWLNAFPPPEEQYIPQLVQSVRQALGLHEDAQEPLIMAAETPLRAGEKQIGPTQEQPEQQRKQATLLFMDIAGHTQMIQSLDPEDMMEIIDPALERLAQPVREYGGRIARFQGDGFKAVFGLPTAHEDDPERATRAGLAILAVAEEIAVELETERGMPGFRVRVGIDTGLVVSGGMTEGDDTIKGITVNLAARLESTAQPGSLQISHNTYRHIRGVFDVLALEPILVKGFSQPVQTYQVLRPKPRAFRMATRGVEGVETHMIGREAELQQLKDIFDIALRESETQLVTIVGDPGIGKSRLLYEFEQWVELLPDHIRIYRGRAMPSASGSPFGLLRSLFAFRFNILENDSLDIVHQKLENGLGEFLHPEPMLKSHYIGAMLGYDFSESPFLVSVRDEPKQFYAQALFYLGQFLTSQTQQNMVLVLLEDIHWSDNASLDAILQLARDHPRLHLMMVSLARPALFDNRPHWGQGETSHTRLELKPLSKRSCRLLVSEIMQKVSNLTDELREQVISNAEGNPFYIEELVKILIEDGVILKDEPEDVWQIDPQRLPDLHIPATLTALLQARLDALPEAERAALQQAAVVGRIFWDAVIQVLQSAEQSPRLVLSQLARRELIYPREASAFAGTEEYIIKHALLRDVVYESVLKRARRVYHRKTADWLVEATQSSGRVDEYAALIAGHYEQAGETLSAAEWYIRGGERALDQGAMLDGRAAFDHALRLLPGSRQDLRWQALLGINSVLAILGNVEQRLASVNGLMEMAGVTNNELWSALAYYRKGSYLDSLGDHRNALASFERALASARQVDDRKLQAKILSMLVISQTRLGEIGAASATTEQLLLIIEGIDEKSLSISLSNISAYYTESGDLARAVLYLRRSVEISHRLGDIGEATALSNLGYAYVLLGRPSEGRLALEQSLQLTESLGSRRTGAYSGLNLGLAYLRLGETDAAQRSLERFIPELAAVGDAFGRAAGKSYQGLVLEQLGDIVGARQRFEEAREIFANMKVPGFTNDALAGLARCALANNDLMEAQKFVGQLWDYLMQHSSKGMEFPIWAYLTCAQVFDVAGEMESSQKALHVGYNELMARAEKISDPEWRASFLNNIPEHREITSWWLRRENQA